MMMRRIAPGEKRNIGLPDILRRPRAARFAQWDANGTLSREPEMSG
jgi:hypothetical protein